MPPDRFVVLRVPWESRTPQRISCALFLKPESVKVTATASLSPTPSTMGEPAAVKKAQKASEDVPAGVTSKVTEPTWSVRTLFVRPLNSCSELLLRSWFWLLPSANVSSTTITFVGVPLGGGAAGWQYDLMSAGARAGACD